MIYDFWCLHDSRKSRADRWLKSKKDWSEDNFAKNLLGASVWVLFVWHLEILGSCFFFFINMRTTNKTPATKTIFKYNPVHHLFTKLFLFYTQLWQRTEKTKLKNRRSSFLINLKTPWESVCLDSVRHQVTPTQGTWQSDNLTAVEIHIHLTKFSIPERF